MPKHKNSSSGMDKASAINQLMTVASKQGSVKGSIFWANKLLPYCDHPEGFPKDVVVHYDDECVTIRDAYPKARYHYLVMPRRHISSLKQITMSDRPLLLQMKSEADRIAKNILIKSNAPSSTSLANSSPCSTLRIGFHAVPSMAQLHLHVISNDFVSDCLKTKRHYLSFTSPFFKSFEDVLTMLDQKGYVKFNDEYEEARLKGPLSCHLCQTEMKNMPSLKKHLLLH